MSVSTKKAKSQANLRFTCLLLLLISWPVVCSGSDSPQASGETSATWGLNLPDRPVSRRISQRSEFKGKRTFGKLTGPGCIRRVWVTGNFISRKDILRIYFDGETIPSVEAPLPDFFGLMHNLTQPGKNYQINTPFLAVKPKLGMTCSIPMPFARSARFEIESPEGCIVYLMVDWHDYPGQQLTEKMRFRARWRREAPVKDFADDYIIADADGPGRLIGFVYAVDMLESRHKMRWSHGGADNIYIDGMGDQPSFLRGIGGEDVFGASHGGADYVAQSSLYSDMPYYIQKDATGDRQKLVGYRFFAHDAIHFYESLHLRFGARAHDASSTVYWYSEKPVRPYFKMPPVKQRLPQTKILRGEYDIPLPDCGSWWLAGPFGKVEPLPKSDGRFDPRKPFIDRPWNKRSSIRGFVEFNHVLRPKASNANSPTLDGWAVAVSKLEAPKEMVADVRLAWDDHLILKVNDDPPIDLGSQPYIRAKSVKVKLRKGTNEVQVWLTNRVGVTRGAWNFAFRATTPEGIIVHPKAGDELASPEKPSAANSTIRITPPDPPNAGLLFVDHSPKARSGHLGHALVEYEDGKILAFYPNCSGDNNGHSAVGWMEFKRSEDGGKTWGEPEVLSYSRNLFEKQQGRTAMAEKAVVTDQGAIVLFYLICDVAMTPLWQPYWRPLYSRSLDGGRTWSEPKPVCATRGRIYDAVYQDGEIRTLHFANDATVSWWGTADDHVFELHVSSDGGKTFSRRSVLPFIAKDRGYGSLGRLGNGHLIAFVYNRTNEHDLDYTTSADGGRTWSEVRTSHFSRKIRNPQFAAFDGRFFMHGRSGAYGEGSGHMILYTSSDGLTWNDGVYLRMRETGTGAYSNNLVTGLKSARGPKRLLIQASHAYRESRTNVLHWWLDESASSANE